jgi:DNA mismatch repair protein MutL
VKELVENALDAGARSVAVRIGRGGIDRIEVSDDGSGIPPEELALAVTPHATSKLAPEGPIERIVSLGFRGEALAAIATAARLRIVSRPPEREEARGLEADARGPGPAFSAGRAIGTTVEIRDLFATTPARRKFLKSPAAEQVEVVRTVERLYLAHPSVGIRVGAEAGEIAAYPPEARLADAAARVLGPELLGARIDVAATVPGGTVRGALGRPTLSAATSRRLFLSVNGRPIESRSLAAAVRAAYGDYLPRARYPVGVLRLEVAPERLDVNVHPGKREVRFADERAIAEALRRRVREALLDAPQVAEARPATPDAPAAGPDRAAVRPSAGPAAPAVQRTLGTPAEARVPRAVAAARGHPALTLLGCLDALYWVAAADDGLLLIDQHAASERVVYDALRRRGRLGRQTLVEPATVRLTGAQHAALRAHGEAVRAAGFDVEPFGPDDVRVRAVPAYRGRTAPASALRELLSELADGGRPTLPDGLEERTAATIACHAAIRAGDPVAVEEMGRVLEALRALPEASYACPHGRPIVIRLPRARLDRWFLRSGA